MKKFRILSVMLAAALVTVACDKDNPTGGGETTDPIVDPNTCTVSFENIADLDIEKTTWVITGEKATEEQWYEMLKKMGEVQAKGEEFYGTIDVVMPDITECPKIMCPLRIAEGDVPNNLDSEYNYVIKSFSAPNMVIAGYYMLSGCQNMIKAHLPKIKRAYYYRSSNNPPLYLDERIIGLVHECRALKELDVPSVEYTANHFAYFSGLEEIHLPSATKLEGYLMGDKTFLSERENEIKIYLTTSENIISVDTSAFSCMPKGTVIYVATEANKTFVDDVLEKHYYYKSSEIKQSDNVTVEL